MMVTVLARTNKPRGSDEIENESISELKEILLSIARADANEILKWSEKREQGAHRKLSKDLSVALSSMKLKSTDTALEVDIKLHDKLKAIELYFKLLESEGADASDGALYIDYDYLSPGESHE